MPQIKQSIVQRVFKLLDNTYFAIPDFDVVFPEEGTAYVEITFRHNPSYRFVVSEEREKSSSLAGFVDMSGKRVPQTRESPGDFKSTESRTHDSFEAALARISKWCENIDTDLRARIPVFAEFDELKRRLDEHLKAADDDADSYFTKAEVETLSQRLDAFAAKVTALEQEQKITQEQLAAAIADLDSIKVNAKTLPKGLWAKLTKSRWISMAKNIASSPEGRKFILEAAEKFLLGNDAPPKP